MDEIEPVKNNSPTPESLASLKERAARIGMKVTMRSFFGGQFFIESIVPGSPFGRIVASRAEVSDRLDFIAVTIGHAFAMLRAIDEAEEAKQINQPVKIIDVNHAEQIRTMHDPS